MKKTKIKDRIENAFDAFFEDQTSNEYSAMIAAERYDLTQMLPSEQLTRYADKYFGYFKKIFSFVPGVLFLHLAAPAPIEFGFGLWGLFWFAAGAFMVWAGLGNLKNKKHFLLPVSVILTAMIFAAPLSFLPANLSGYYIYFYIGILPLLFIAPILTKGWVDKNNEK